MFLIHQCLSQPIVYHNIVSLRAFGVEDAYYVRCCIEGWDDERLGVAPRVLQLLRLE